MNPPEIIIEAIRKNSTFLITSHINPEGDAIGSELALALALEKMGKVVDIRNLHPVPEIYKFLPHSERVKPALKIFNRGPALVPTCQDNRGKADKVDKRYDTLLLLDCGSLNRTGWISDHSLLADNIFVIDHHRTESPFKNNGWIEPGASSTGEMIYNLIASLGIDIDSEMAINIYTAIMTDTGSFRYSSTTPEAFRIAGILVGKGVNPSKINEEVYEKLPFRKLKLLGYAMKTIDRNQDGKVAWMTVNQRMFRLTGAGPEDTEEFVNNLMSIKGVEVAILFRQTGSKSYKLSFRSKGKIDVAGIAEALGGGGHSNASGCELKGTLSEIKNKIVEMVEKAIAT